MVMQVLEAQHQIALRWFADRTGQDVSWPSRLSDGTFLLNKAKGIHKPKGWRYALSVREAINSPYADRDIVFDASGNWRFDYYQEGSDPASRDNDFTNKALMMNLADGVPVGVVRQIKAKPHPRYHVMGLAQVVNWNNGYFQLVGSLIPDVSSGTLETSFELALNDARKRIRASIVVREGAEAFRMAAFETFNGQCAISGCAVSEVLQAAHIVPYLGAHTNNRNNALLLRADIHTLFDKQLLTIDPVTLSITVHGDLMGTEYGKFDGRKLRAPASDNTFLKAALCLRAGLSSIEDS